MAARARLPLICAQHKAVGPAGAQVPPQSRLKQTHLCRIKVPATRPQAWQAVGQGKLLSCVWHAAWRQIRCAIRPQEDSSLPGVATRLALFSLYRRSPFGN